MGAIQDTPNQARTTPLLQLPQHATPEEIAALGAVFAARGSAPAEPAAPRRTPEWQANHRKLRRTFPHGPGCWRASALPR